MMCTRATPAALLVLIHVLGSVTAQVACPDGFVVVDDKCFKFVLEGMNWSEAETNCEALGGHLAILDDCRLWVDVVKKINAQGMHTSSFYIGATDVVEEGVWLWLNGENVEMGLPFWGGDGDNPEPNDGDAKNYAVLWTRDRHYFYDSEGTVFYGSICQVAPTVS